MNDNIISDEHTIWYEEEKVAGIRKLKVINK